MSIRIKPVDEFIINSLINGKMDAISIIEKAKKNGFSKHLLHRASIRIGVIKRKNSMAGGWTWELPEEFELAKNLEEGAHDA